MLQAMERTGNPGTYESWNKSVPVLLICGAQDPVGSMGKAATAVKNAMDKAGIPVRFHLLPNCRHMVLGEERSGAAETARNLIAEFLSRGAAQ